MKQSHYTALVLLTALLVMAVVMACAPGLLFGADFNSWLDGTPIP